MRRDEEIKGELDYLSEPRTPQTASYDSITAELMFDCRRILLVLAEKSGIPIWEEDFQLNIGKDSA